MELTKFSQSSLAHPLDIAQAANQWAAGQVFDDYRSRKAQNTLTRQDNDLSLFADCLADVGIRTGSLSTDPAAWSVVTWGLVEGFKRWQLEAGYSVSSVNVRLSTIKSYAKLALKAGTLDRGEYALIRAVSGYDGKEGRRIDEQRRSADLPTRFERKGAKKADSVPVTRQQADSLKTQPETLQGRRDCLLMCLLLDHGLRCGEVALLKVEDFDLQSGEFRFYRPKVDKAQTHKMTLDTLRAARSYLSQLNSQAGPLLQASRKGGHMTHSGMTERAITKRVKALGEAVGLNQLSAHDLRHYWATQAARNGTPIDRLQDAGGWNSPAMPLRYIESAKVANQGVLLG